MLFQTLKENYPFWFKSITCFVLISLATLSGASGQIYAETGSRSLIIRSGLIGAIGYSRLYLSDAVRPFYTTSEYYSFTPDLFGKVGAIVIIQPRFFSEKLELVFVPAFTKFSYGDYKEVEYGNYINAIDLDVESLEFPISLRYNFLRGPHSIKPFIRGGYSYSFFIDTESEFISKEWSGGELIDYRSTEFSFSKFQDAVSLCLGMEFDLHLVDCTLELVIEKGDGIHEDKFGDNFLKMSSTTSVYLQVGVLF